jgi:syntaxin 1B/2/3
MNDLMTDSFVAAAAKAQEGGAPASSAGGDAPELRAFLTEADAAKAEMAALRDELSRLRAAHEASRHAVGSGGGRAATQAALVRLLGSARRLRARLASMDRRAPAPAAHAAAGLRGRVHDLTADVEVLRRQVSAERREDAARRYLAVSGDAPTEDQLERLLANTDESDSDAAMRAALLSSAAAPAAAAAAAAEEEQEEAAKEVAEVERGLLELQQLFLDMAALVEAQGAPLDDIERHVAAAAGGVGAAEAELAEARRLQGEARRRRACLAGGVAALLLVGVAVAVVAALVLARKGGGGGGKVVLLQVAAGFPAR